MSEVTSAGRAIGDQLVAPGMEGRIGFLFDGDPRPIRRRSYGIILGGHATFMGDVNIITASVTFGREWY